MRQREDHRDRLHLRDHDDAAGIARLHIVAGVDEPQTDPAIAGGDDAAIVEIERGILDVGFVGQHDRLILQNEGTLGIDLLARNRVLRHQLLIACQIDPGGGQERFIARELALRLVQCGLIGTRVDLRQKVALPDALAFR